MSRRVRIAPLEPPYEPDIERLLAKWMPPGSDVAPLALFRTLAVHDELAARMRPLGAGILGSRIVPPPTREVLIARTCALCGAEYEWGVHAVAFGKPLGLTDEQLLCTVHGGADDACWNTQQRNIIRLADELHHTSTISDELFDDLRADFDDRQILELTATAGWYHTIAYLIGVAGVAAEPWAAQFPSV
ncbi:carboxymuconolactone decarboxylase family protein [Mycobacterium sp. 852002-50816_SCH5313054-b]|uniref:carboxymuconolactone decarboxylase family protein n=1 Tax=Mycobacterium sp. 852002-50816_SCH5313054-b TaxID=1834092 RepID=UPI0009EDBA21|nr:carboxymuconolactone decarboxylase family protein [Mycobacterium sp. 852002-50816_SCH5313054-b]